MQYVQNRIHAYKSGLSVPYDTAPLKQPQPMALFVLLSSLDWTVVTLLSGCPQYLLDKHGKVQNAAARLVEKSDHIHPTLQALHWLPVTHRVQYKILTVCFSSVSGTSPQYLSAGSYDRHRTPNPLSRLV